MDEYEMNENDVIIAQNKYGFSPTITDFAHMDEVLASKHISYEGKVTREDILFCKIESQQDCIVGNLCIPKLRDMSGGKYEIALFITKNDVVIVDDDGFAEQIIDRSHKINPMQYETKEKFLYFFITEFMNRDLNLLNEVEKKLMDLEAEILAGEDNDANGRLSQFRRKMLTLRCYYEEMVDVGKALEENENGYFRKGQLKYFGTIADRADRLMNRATHLLDLGRQVKETQQSIIDQKHNANMQFLTVMSAVFFPLTLITGWYGMNFENMPELANGYPFVIGGSIGIVLIVFIVFKIKKLL